MPAWLPGLGRLPSLLSLSEPTPALLEQLEAERRQADRLRYPIESVRELIAWRLRRHLFEYNVADFLDLADVALAAIADAKLYHLPEHQP